MVGQLASTYNGSTTTTDSYWTPETTMQDDSKAGNKRSIQTMLYSTGYASTYDFYSIWNIRDGYTLGYLLNLDIPTQVNRENINYQAYEIQGRGTVSNPYLISNAIQLQKINENLSANYKLVSNINLTGVEWTAIGNDKYKFTGTLDGNGYTISNLNLQSTNINQGLFGYNAGTIKNVNLDSLTVTGTTNVGGLAGCNEGTITNCTITNSNISGTDNVGGLVGYTIANMSGNSSGATVVGNNQVGGLIGYVYSNNKDLTIDTSKATRNS